MPSLTHRVSLSLASCASRPLPSLSSPASQDLPPSTPHPTIYLYFRPLPTLFLVFAPPSSNLPQLPCARRPGVALFQSPSREPNSLRAVRYGNPAIGCLSFAFLVLRPRGFFSARSRLDLCRKEGRKVFYPMVKAMGWRWGLGLGGPGGG